MADPTGDGAVALLTLIEDRPAPDVLVLHVSGELDLATAPRLQAAVAAATGHLVVDLTSVTFLGSHGLRVLLDCTERTTTVLVGVEHPAVARPLRLTGLDFVFQVHPSVSAALAARG